MLLAQQQAWAVLNESLLESVPHNPRTGRTRRVILTSHIATGYCKMGAKAQGKAAAAILTSPQNCPSTVCTWWFLHQSFSLGTTTTHGVCLLFDEVVEEAVDDILLLKCVLGRMLVCLLLKPLALLSYVLLFFFFSCLCPLFRTKYLWSFVSLLAT
ncbi:unnamed protein product [Urochloa humidicola]